MTQKNNLCSDCWIPVNMLDGRAALHSLESLFEQAEHIRDLALSPTERIAVMRLLICIAQRALNGPADEEQKEECQGDIIPRSLEYLRQWRQAFELVGRDGAFLQVPHLSPKDTTTADSEQTDYSKLNLSLASGNNPTLFDNAGGSKRNFSFSQKALALLTYQNFSPGGRIAELRWNKLLTAGEGSSNGAPCSAGSALHLFLLGNNLLDTIWMNLIPVHRHTPTKGQLGKPIWEHMPQSPQDAAAITNATTSLLGRLVPMSRCIRLTERGILLGNGLEYPTYDKDKRLLYWEPSMRLRKVKDNKANAEKTSLVGNSLERAIWRSLPAMLKSFENEQSWLYDNEELPERFCIWVGGIILDKAKILGEAESYFPNSSASTFKEETIRNLHAALKKAEDTEHRLKSAVKRYYESMAVSENIPHERAIAPYWEQLSAQQSAFLKTADGSPEHDAAWEQLCHRACRRAYDHCCPHSTARQMQAWVKAWQHHTKTSS